MGIRKNSYVSSKYYFTHKFIMYANGAVGHGLSRSAILVLLVFFFRALGVINDLGPCVSLGGTVQSAFRPGRFSMFPGNVLFLAHSSQAQQTGTNILYSTHKGLDFLNFQLLFIGQVWNALARISGPVSTPVCVAVKSVKIKRCKCPCVYYSNSTATFHCLLEGDLVFKLNPGPSGRPIPIIVSVRDEPGQTHNNGHNLNNLSCVQPAKLRPMNMSQSLLSFCLINARSVRNKTAMLMDYICDLKADLYAMTETWLTENDASVRVELIPDGYNLLDQPRVGRGGGGTGLLYRNDLRVKKVESGEKKSFEFSEWIISSTGHDIRLSIIYRPPYSDEHQVPTSVFFTEFSEYLESAVLSKENLLISGDFNIHVDNIHDSDAIKFSDLLKSFGLKQHVTRPTH